jgi:hypothetical protein
MKCEGKKRSVTRHSTFLTKVTRVDKRCHGVHKLLTHQQRVPSHSQWREGTQNISPSPNTFFTTITTTTTTSACRCSVVDIATCCGLQCSKFESLRGRNFPQTSRPVLRISLRPVRYRGYFLRVKRKGREADVSPLATGRGVAWVQLQLYLFSVPPAVCYGVTFTLHHHHTV